MIFELNEHPCPEARRLSIRPRVKLALDAVIEDDGFGKLWVDNIARPGTALMWTGSDRHYQGVSRRACSLWK